MMKKANNIITPKYNCIPDRPDDRDYIYCMTNPITPDRVDLRQYCTPIENEELLVSSTSNAIANAIEFLNNKNQIANDVSRLFINYHERLLVNNRDIGNSIRNGIKAVCKNGFTLEKLWPYDINKIKAKPNIPAIADSSKRKITLYEKILDHDGCIDCITNGYPVIIGLKIYSSFEKSNLPRTGFMPYPDTCNETCLGGHVVLLVGYDKVNQIYIARNNRGSSWGDNGYFYIPFDVVHNTEMCSDFWAIKTVSNLE